MAARVDPPVAPAHVAVAPHAKGDDRPVEPSGVQLVPGRLPHRLRLRLGRRRGNERGDERGQALGIWPEVRPGQHTLAEKRADTHVEPGVLAVERLLRERPQPSLGRLLKRQV